MKLFMILLVTAVLKLTYGGRLGSIKRRRESQWDIIHHEYHGPAAPLSDDGTVMDTPEVAMARANHLAIHAETVAELARKMAEEEKRKHESAKMAEAEEPAKAPEHVEMTPELIQWLMEAAEELQQHQEEKEPKMEVEKPIEEEPEAMEPELEAPEEETKPVIESEFNYDIFGDHPVAILQRRYEGPMAPLADDGRVMDTTEVRKAKESHQMAFEQAVKLAKSAEERKKKNKEAESKQEFKTTWYETPNAHRRVYVPPVQLVYHRGRAVSYKRAVSPIGRDARLVDTTEIERAKAAHRRSYQHTETVVKRHPPKYVNNYYWDRSGI